MKSLFAAFIALAFSLAAQAEDRSEGMFADWLRTADTADFEQSLEEADLGKVVPLYQLLRTATDWRACGGPAFEIPPRAQWPDVRSVLLLVKELKKRQFLTQFEAVSGYRNPSLNACAGGARSSAHAQQFAIDIVTRAENIDEKLLCQFWKTEGQAWNMGLSKYPSGRIHLDTAGYRTWGADHKRGSSFCVRDS